jgi:hypothetical protein
MLSTCNVIHESELIIACRSVLEFMVSHKQHVTRTRWRSFVSYEIKNCADISDENSQRHNSDASSVHSSAEVSTRQRLENILQPLLKAACGARGRQGCQNAPGMILATALRALFDSNGPISSQSQAVLLSMSAQIASMLDQGSLRTDNVGSLQALHAAWEQLQWSTEVPAKCTRLSLQAIVKTLTGKGHWRVCSQDAQVIL